MRYALFAVRAAYAPSTPVSAAPCSFPLLLSVPVAPMWQVEHAWLNSLLPRSAAEASKLAAGGGGVDRLCW